jgi:ABC-type phosphate transport system ATPase subunit
MTVTLVETKHALEIRRLNAYYGDFLAVRNVSMQIERNRITALIGPSGCGKSTLLRALNRMNELVPGAHMDGEVLFHGQNLYAPEVDPVEVRRRIGMVFQKPNPFPKSIFDNVAYGPRILGVRDKRVLGDIVEHSLSQAALWDEVKDDLKKSGLALSGGQQQRLCIARALASAGDYPDGRTVLCAGPDRHPAHRGFDARTTAELHDCHRDAQYAGRALSDHRLMPGRKRRRVDRI